jgi:hypothetical protein
MNAPNKLDVGHEPQGRRANRPEGKGRRGTIAGVRASGDDQSHARDDTVPTPLASGRRDERVCDQDRRLEVLIMAMLQEALAFESTPSPREAER